MRVGSCLIFAVWLALVSIAHADRAVPETRIESARGMAMGTGARASAASTQAQADNPANLVVGGVYHIESFVGYDPTFKRTAWGASLMDSSTSRLAAGVSARLLFGDNDAGSNDGWELRGGLGFPIIEMLSVGVAGRYSRLHIADTHAIPDRPATLSGAGLLPPGTSAQEVDREFRLRHFTLDASATLRPVRGLNVSALGYNLINTKSKLAPTLVGGSIAFTSGGFFTVGGDVLVDLNRANMFGGPRLIVGGGIEYLALNVLPLRFGYAYDQGRDQSFLTGGAGYVDTRFSIQAAVRQSVNQGSETSLFFSAAIFVQ